MRTIGFCQSWALVGGCAICGGLVRKKARLLNFDRDEFLALELNFIKDMQQ